jgi:hypothetical protein
MRVSLWRQFSGNHSSSFTLVGVFDSPEAAQEGAERLRAMLEQIAIWREQHPLPNGWAYDDPTPPELELAQQYGVEWTYGLDWLSGPEDVDDLITTFDRLILINPYKVKTPTRNQEPGTRNSLKHGRASRAAGRA